MSNRKEEEKKPEPDSVADKTAKATKETVDKTKTAAKKKTTDARKGLAKKIDPKDK